MVFEDGLGEIQWPSKPDLPHIKKPGLHLFRTLNSVEPNVYTLPSASPRQSLVSWFCNKLCSCCIFKSPGCHLKNNRVVS